MTKPTKHSLQNFVVITAGHHYRKQVVPDPEGKYRVLQTLERSLTIDLEDPVDWDQFIKVNSEKIHRKRIGVVTLKPHDIILVSRGNKYPATYFENPPDNIIVPSYYFIFRCDESICLPEYLYWLLNRSRYQTELKKLALGTNVQFLSKENIVMFASFPTYLPLYSANIA